MKCMIGERCELELELDELKSLKDEYVVSD